MGPQVVSDTLVQALVGRFQVGLLERCTAGGAQQVTDELKRLTAQGDDFTVNAHLVTTRTGKGVNQEQRHIGARLWVQRGQVTVNARKPLREQVGNLFVRGIAGIFEFLKQLFHLPQMQQHIVFEGPRQHFGQRLATQVNTGGLAQCFQVVQKGDDHVDHAFAIGLGDFF